MRVPAVIIAERKEPHTLIHVGHEHLGPGLHRNTGKCSCGQATYVSTAQTDLRARGGLRERHRRHLKAVKQQCTTAT